MQVKICGISSKEDVEMISSLKPDYMGFVINCPQSPRSIDRIQAIDLVSNLKIPIVFLFVNETVNNILKICKELTPFAIQLHGEETPTTLAQLKQIIPHIKLWKAIHLPVDENKKDMTSYLKIIEEYVDVGCDLFILDSSTKDSYGGTGLTCDWELASKIVAQIKTPIMLAGGLTFSNVKSAIKTVKPFGVDVSSGVELTKAKKDKHLVSNFINEVRS